MVALVTLNIWWVGKCWPIGLLMDKMMKVYFLLLMLICQQTVSAASLEKAQLLYEHGFTDKAKLELIENIVSQ